MICAPVLPGLGYIYSSSFPDHVTQSAGDLLFGIQGNFCPNIQSRAKEVGMEYCENVLAQDMGWGSEISPLVQESCLNKSVGTGPC